MKEFGIDEAGKGPIIGPLVMSAVIVEDLGVLEQLNIKDSKQLTAEQREDVYEELKDLVTHDTVILEPEEIDRAVATHDYNWLEAKHTAALINRHWPDKAIIDCPSRNPRAYKSFIYERLDKKDVTLVCEHKADENHAVCAAASIIAKVTRDRIIEKMKEETGLDFGSGYLSDPKTQRFLEAHWETHADLFRKSYAPYRALVLAKGQTSLSAYW